MLEPSLSPAAQAVWDAYITCPAELDLEQSDRNAVAAAFRAAAADMEAQRWEPKCWVYLQAIAAELEGIS